MRNLKATLLASAFALVAAAAANAAVYTVPSDVSAGRLNIRSGPGTNHALLGYIPAGETVDVGRCLPRDDRINGSDFCRVTYNGVTGWAASSGLMPGRIPPPRAQAPHEPEDAEDIERHTLECTPPLDRRDRNPVVKIWVKFEYDRLAQSMGSMNVEHQFYNGGSVNRFDQYVNVRTLHSHNIYGWGGTYNREPDKTMLGGAYINNGQWFYRESQYRYNALLWDNIARCEEVGE